MLTIIITSLVCAISGAGIGLFASKSLQGQKAKDKEKDLEEKAKLVVKEAEIQAEKVKNERILESKNTSS